MLKQGKFNDESMNIKTRYYYTIFIAETWMKFSEFWGKISQQFDFYFSKKTKSEFLANLSNFLDISWH